MPNFLKSNILMIVILAMVVEVSAQKTITQYVAEGKNQLGMGQVYSAIESFRKALDFDTTNAEIAYLYAGALCKAQNFCKSIEWYERTLKYSDTATYPNAILDLGIARKNCGDYTGALSALKRALILTDNIKQLKEKHQIILHEITAVEFAIAHLNDSVKYDIQPLPTPVNTYQSEFNPVPMPGGKLVFSSYKTLFADSFSTIFSTFYTSSIYQTQSTVSGWKTPESFDEQINSNKWFTANICFADHQRRAYFTRCIDNNGRIGNCNIYVAEKKSGRWTRPKKLPEFINQTGTTTTQPYYVEGEEFDVLYFVSNREGGYGGTDIWYCIVKDGKYQEPSNLGLNINTKGNEMTPFYDPKSTLLYFSSDYLPGFGGFDIFVSKGGFNQWENPVNMGLPINSENNDLYFTPIDYSNDAYLSSNRLGSLTTPGADYCCSDIYIVRGEKINIPPPTTDSLPLIEVTVESRIKQLLPISLYFDNDIPNPNSTSDTTSEEYKSLLNNYLKQRELYQEKYSQGLTGEEAKAARDSIRIFFEQQVEGGFSKLETFVDLLKTELSEGKSVNIAIKGFASPLNTPEYNYNLSKRRIASLINFLKAYESGYFKPFLEGTDSLNRRITILQDPRGDKTAASYVSSNPNDKRNSVYSKAAALERRIQIIMYQSGDSAALNDKAPSFNGIVNIVTNETIKAGEPVIGKLIFTNQSNFELEIMNLYCDSQTIQFQPEQLKIKPHQSETVHFLLKTSGFEPGQQILKIKTKSNALNELEMEIKITIIP